MSDRQTAAGIYGSRSEAERVRSRLVESGLSGDRIQVVARVRANDNSAALADTDGVLKDVLIEGTAGTLVGTGLGAMGEAALAAANITLFTTSPFLAPLAMLGWGAAVGGLIGAAIGASGVTTGGTLSDILLYAIRRGHVTLVVHTQSDEEDRLVSAALGASKIEQTKRRMGDRLH